MAVRKQFSKTMYDLVDTPSKETLVKYLESQGHTISSTEENYYVDVVSRKEGKMYFNEVEVKLGWKGDWNPAWEEIRIPERKARLLDKYQDISGFLNFYIISGDWKHMWRIKDSLLTPESLKVAKGRWIKPGEKFFHIPYKQAELITLEGN